MQLPQSFISIIENQLGAATQQFVEALAKPAPVSIRLNPTKPSSAFANLEPVAWHKDGRYLPERPVFTLDPAFHAGAYYVQEASSMFIAEALKQVLDFDNSLKIMDLCAAPGGKTTTVASLMNNDSLLVANEVIKSRVGVLKENLEKWGFGNYVVTNHDPEELSDLEGFFDAVLVDAPCSGEGMFRKDPKAVNEWSPEHVQLCSARQKRILQAAAMLVKPEGFMVYSTCTYNETENEQNVEWLCKTFDFEVVTLQIPTEWGIVGTTSGHQFYPHLTQGEGFFCTVLKKTEGEENFVEGRIKLNNIPKKYVPEVEKWIADANDFEFYFKSDNATVVAIPASLTAEYGSIFRAVFKRSSGLEIGMFKGQDFIPSHQLALSRVLPHDVQSIELDRENALKFLKREDFDVQTEQTGWVLVKYEGLNLGWIKVLNGGRINNYLPKEWRIRMEIPE